ncbi:hypothetical protein WICMUC_000825 [Wickerhamomyces mucosus]|uniref:NADH:ubiquinone oxidoreductase intermediate-associated protein 30 domain-containing protein n=1 Tax=Wickerhamomyces mucosus TaxID=1378264 RepID=A0A9P8THB6_9ASCO|nr:hypothetical protein WICMUC_000825 [Wickerhamomyces mucosus]
MLKNLAQRVSSYFTRPNELSKIITGSDQDIGGFSTVKFDIETEKINGIEKSFGNFHGYLNLDPPSNKPDVLYSGYSMFRTKNQPKTFFNNETFWDWDGLNHVLLRVKGDHRKYFVNIQSHSTFITDLYQHRLFLNTPGKWETVLIPLNGFVLTNKGVIQHQVPLEKTKVKTIGIGLLDAQFGPYSLKIDSIKVMRGTDALEEIEKSKILSESEPDLFLRG